MSSKTDHKKTDVKSMDTKDGMKDDTKDDTKDDKKNNSVPIVPVPLNQRLAKVVEWLKTEPEKFYGRVYDDGWLYLELGRKQTMYVGPGTMSPQITIRDIRVQNKSDQKKGVLSTIVHFILNTVGAVQLESVTNASLSEKLQKSPKWYCLDPSALQYGNASFARQKKGSGESSGTIF